MGGKKVATIYKRVCDRCGVEMQYSGWTAVLKNVIKRRSRPRVVRLLNGNPDGFSYMEEDYDLCAECTKKLEDFLRGKELQV